MQHSNVFLATLANLYISNILLQFRSRECEIRVLGITPKIRLVAATKKVFSNLRQNPSTVLKNCQQTELG